MVEPGFEFEYVPSTSGAEAIADFQQAVKIVRSTLIGLREFAGPNDVGILEEAYRATATLESIAERANPAVLTPTEEAAPEGSPS